MKCNNLRDISLTTNHDYCWVLESDHDWSIAVKLRRGTLSIYVKVKYTDPWLEAYSQKFPPDKVPFWEDNELLWKNIWDEINSFNIDDLYETAIALNIAEELLK